MDFEYSFVVKMLSIAALYVILIWLTFQSRRMNRHSRRLTDLTTRLDSLHTSIIPIGMALDAFSMHYQNVRSLLLQLESAVVQKDALEIQRLLEEVRVEIERLGIRVTLVTETASQINHCSSKPQPKGNRE